MCIFFLTLLFDFCPYQILPLGLMYTALFITFGNSCLSS